MKKIYSPQYRVFHGFHGWFMLYYCVMSNGFQKNKMLRLELEVLRSQLGIRNFYLDNSVKDIYENMGQILSTVKMQLEVLDTELVGTEFATLAMLIGNCIRNLRAMSKSFYPERDIVNDEGFVEGCKYLIYQLFELTEVITEGEVEVDLAPEVRLISFKIVLDILKFIKKANSTFDRLYINDTEDKVILTIAFTGSISLVEEGIAKYNIALLQRVKLIEAELKTITDNNGKNQIQLTIPTKLLFV